MAAKRESTVLHIHYVFCIKINSFLFLAALQPCFCRERPMLHFQINRTVKSIEWQLQVRMGVHYFDVVRDVSQSKCWMNSWLASLRFTLINPKDRLKRWNSWRWKFSAVHSGWCMHTLWGRYISYCSCCNLKTESNWDKKPSSCCRWLVHDTQC